MVTRKGIFLSIIATLLFIAPHFVHAQSAPEIDTFDAFNSNNWVHMPGYLLFSNASSTSSCYIGGCVFGTGNAPGMYLGGLPYTDQGFVQLEFDDYMDNGSGDQYYLCMKTSEDGTAQSVCKTFGGQTGWHSFIMYWRPNAGTGTIENCSLIDDYAEADCSWTDSFVPNGETFPYVQIWENAGVIANHMGLDELSGSSAIEPTSIITNVLPAPDSTTTPSLLYHLQVDGNVGQQDFVDGNTNVYIRYRQLTGMGMRGNPTVAQSGDATLRLNSAGSFSVSTTTAATNTGVWAAYAAIQKPTFSVFGISFFTTTVASLTWNFVVGTATPSEIASSQMLLETSGLGSGTASSTASSNLECQFLSSTFSLSGCISFLIFPSSVEVSNDLDQVKSGIVKRAPWGYAYRTYTIMASSSVATSSLPAFTATVKTSATNTESLTFDPGDMLAGGGALLGSINDGSGHTVRSVTEPWIRLFIAITVIIIIFHDIMGMGNATKDAPEVKMRANSVT